MKQHAAGGARVARLTRAALALCLLAPAIGAEAKLAPCRISGIKNEVQCGSVERALDPAQPQGVKIALSYVVVPATARRKLPDAVFLLAGGPGQSAVALASAVLPVFARLNNRRDIVFVDQRGTGKSAPLECADPRELPLAEQTDPRAQERQALQCRERLLQLPYVKTAENLRFFTTSLAVQDLDAVRRQLGGAPINLVGASYGTRAALEYLRQFPQAVRRVVIDGVAPPDMVLPASMSSDTQAAFDALLAACEKDADCARRHPRLRADWAALLARLPQPVTLAHPLTGRSESFTLTREMLLGLVRGPLYAPALAAALPAALTEAAQGRLQPLVGLASLLAPRRGAALALGMHFSVVCAEDAPRMAQASDAPGADFGAEFAASYRRICAAWPRGEVPPGFYDVPVSAAPVLLFSGGLDPVTPPRHGERVARALGAKALHVVVPNAGHGVMNLGCTRDVIFRFIDAAGDAEALQVDAACVKGIPRPPAFVPVTARERAP